MNKNTLILVIAVLLLLIPTSVIAKRYVFDKFEKLGGEGIVAISVAKLDTDKKAPESTPTPNPNPVQSTCDKCKGTQMVRSGDGLAQMKCPCGDNCQCQPMKAVPTKSTRKQIVFVSTPKWCPPCKQVEQYTAPRLIQGNWLITDVGRNLSFNLAPHNKITAQKASPINSNNSHIMFYDGDLFPDIAAKYSVIEYPTWILLENDKEVNRYSGFLNDYGVLHFWNQEKIQDSDRILKN